MIVIFGPCTRSRCLCIKLPHFPQINHLVPSLFYCLTKTTLRIKGSGMYNSCRLPFQSFLKQSVVHPIDCFPLNIKHKLKAFNSAGPRQAITKFDCVCRLGDDVYPLWHHLSPECPIMLTT